MQVELALLVADLELKERSGLPDVRACDVVELLPQLHAEALRAPRSAAVSSSLESRQAGRHRQRVRVERPAVADSLLRPGVEERHHVRAAAESADRQPAADDLAEVVRSGAMPARPCAPL